jgi:hypothetical protein
VIAAHPSPIDSQHLQESLPDFEEYAVFLKHAVATEAAEAIAAAAAAIEVIAAAAEEQAGSSRK